MTLYMSSDSSGWDNSHLPDYDNYSHLHNYSDSRELNQVLNNGVTPADAYAHLEQRMLIEFRYSKNKKNSCNYLYVDPRILGRRRMCPCDDNDPTKAMETELFNFYIFV